MPSLNDSDFSGSGNFSGDFSCGSGYLENDSGIQAIEIIDKFLNHLSLSLQLVGVFGNLLIISYFLTNNKKNIRKMSTYHFLLLHLAIIDILVCLLETPYNLMNTSLISFNKVIQYLSWFTEPLHLQSMFGLFLVSFARYQSIVHPFNTKWRKRRYLIISVITLIISFLAYTPDLMSMVLKFEMPYYTLGADTGITLLFFTILIVLYFKMRKVLRGAQECRSKERNKKALKTLKFLLGLFGVSMVLSKLLIYCIRRIIPEEYLLNMSDSEFTAMLILEAFSIEMLYLNNIGNFFIYLKMMPGIRYFLSRTFCCCIHRKNPDSGTATGSFE